MGGAAFFIIIFLFCGVILCVRRSHKKRSLSLNDKMVIELNSDVKMDGNPSYSIITQNEKQDNQYEYVLHNKFSMQDNTKDTIKMDSNPSYGRVQGCNTVAYDATEQEYDVIIQTNASYNSILKETTNMSEDEDQHGYVETNTHRGGYLKVTGSPTKEEESVYDVATNDIDNVKINPNPCYDSVSRGVKLEPTIK